MIEVKAGYKQTELGVIPEDWSIENISNLSTLKARIGWQGLTTAEYLESGNYYLVTGTDLTYGKVNWKTCCFVDKIRYDQDKNIQLKVEDVLVTKDGTIGKIAFVDSLSLPTTLNSGVFVIRPKNGAYLPEYLYCILNSIYFDDFLAKLTAGSTISHLYQKDFVDFKFPLPTKSEQTAIATILSDTDALIEHLEKLIAKKKAIKQGAMQQLLTGKKRLPGFSGEWEVEKIKNISSITTGAKNTQDKIDDAEYPFFVRSSIVERINSYSFDGEAVLTAGDGVGTGKIFHYINGKFDFHQRVYKMSHFDEKVNGYFFYLFFSNYFLKRIMAMTAKSSVDSVRMEMIAEMPIPLPPRSEQTAIATILFDMDTEIEALEQTRDKYAMLKQGMMQQLLTGRIRIHGTN